MRCLTALFLNILSNMMANSIKTKVPKKEIPSELNLTLRFASGTLAESQEGRPLKKKIPSESS